MFEKEAEEYANQSCFTEMPNPSLSEDIDISDEIKEAVLYGYNKANEWHLLKDRYPEINKLVRVRTFSGMEYVCTTDWYYPTEDEIGYGHALFSFYTLNDDWIDENEIKAWCELQPVPKEIE